MSAGTHRWYAPLDLRVAIVNGVEKRIPRVCISCLVRDDSPEADYPCDRSCGCDDL